jgi:hypothetical protein
VAGFDLFEAADLDETIEIESKSPVIRFCPFEIRPFEALVLGSEATAFAEGDDSAGIPYLLTVWVDAKQPPLHHNHAVLGEYEAWRHELGGTGVFVLGGSLSGPETATTLRFRDAAIQISDGPFLDVDGFIAGIDVIRAADRKQATQIAGDHPLARYHTIEVEQFYTE